VALIRVQGAELKPQLYALVEKETQARAEALNDAKEGLAQKQWQATES